MDFTSVKVLDPTKIQRAAYHAPPKGVTSISAEPKDFFVVSET